MSRARDRADGVLHNRTHEDTEGGRESLITFKGEQSGGEISTLAQIQASHDGTSDDEKSDLIFKTNDGSDGTSPTEAMRIDSGQNVGIGISPFANSLGKSLDIVNGVGLFGYNNNSYLSTNAHYDSAWKYKATDEAAFVGLESASFRFNTAASGTAGSAITFTERARFDADGLKFNGDTAAANALDDYEEGTFTPAISGLTFSKAQGQYVKVGQMVFIAINLQQSNTSKTSQDINVTGLPFAAASVTGGDYAANSIPIFEMSNITLASGYANIYGRINQLATQVQLLQSKIGNHAAFTGGGGFSSSGTIRFSFTYRAA